MADSLLTYFPSPLLVFLMYLFFCLKDTKLVWFLFAYLAYFNFIRLSIGLQGWSLKFYFLFFFPGPFLSRKFPLIYPPPSPICNSDSLLPQNRAFTWIRLANNFCEVAFSNGVITQWCTNVVFALLVGKQRSG